MEDRDRKLAIALIIYLLITGVGSATAVLKLFPTVEENAELKFPGSLTSDHGLILLASLAGMTGSFLHATQSLASYLGNASFKASWTAWYGLRPWIGAVLGFVIYFAFRAGLVTGPNAANPYGVVAIGLLSGWFSKTTTDKLQEVWDTLFKTSADAARKDKLTGHETPIVVSVNPSPVPQATNEITVNGRNFQEGASVLADTTELQTQFVSATELKATVQPRPGPAARVTVKVRNPTGNQSLSEGVVTVFE